MTWDVDACPSLWSGKTVGTPISHGFAVWTVLEGIATSLAFRWGSRELGPGDKNSSYFQVNSTSSAFNELGFQCRFR